MFKIFLNRFTQHDAVLIILLNGSKTVKEDMAKTHYEYEIR